MKSGCKRATRSRRISTTRFSRRRSSRWSPTCHGERRCSSAAPGSTSPPGIREPGSPAENSTFSSRTSLSRARGLLDARGPEDSPDLDSVGRSEIERLAGLHVEGDVPGIEVAHRVAAIFGRCVAVCQDSLSQRRFPDLLPPALREGEEELLVVRQALDDRRLLAAERKPV